MAKKGIDAEALKKNHFWIILGLFAVLWLVAAVMAKVTAGDAKKKAWEEAKTKIDSAWKAGPKTEAYQTPWNEHSKRFSDHKDVIWKDAWDQQKNVFFWPREMPRSAIPLYPDDYFAPRNPDGTFTNITLDQNNRNAFKRDWYPTQFAELLDYCDPAEFNGGFYAVFPMQQWDTRGTPTREEIWLAQEDFWVRREMMFMIRNAMDTMAVLQDVTSKEDLAKEQERIKKKEKAPDGVELKRVFRNTNWELTLLIKRDETGRSYIISRDSTIKNINPNDRTLMLAHPKSSGGLPFRLVQNGGRVLAPLEIAGEPLAAGASMRLNKEYRTTPVDVTRPFEVIQELAWDNSPIRRIDVLALGYHSHRTVTAALKVNEDLKKLDPDPEGDAAAAPTGGEGMMGGMMGGPMGGSPGGGGGSSDGGMGAMMGGRMGGGGAAADATRVNRIDRARYIQVTPQCRHLPVAMRLIVDQAHVHDILAAVANSRLRIQITQVTLVHAPEVKRGVLGSAAGGGLAGGGRPLGGMGGPGVGGMGGPGAGSPDGGEGEGGRGGSRAGGLGMGFPSRPTMPGMMRGGGLGGPGVGEGMPGMPGMAGPGMPGAGGAAERATFTDTAHLVELSIYGIAALYERFPPRPKSDAPAAPAGSDAAPTK